MRKRRWWFAGLALALLAACVGVWKWSERPPYAFLAGGKRYFAEIAPSDGVAVSYFVVSQPLVPLIEGAKHEVGPHFIRGGLGKDGALMKGWLFKDTSILEWPQPPGFDRLAGDFPPVPKNATGIVVTYTKADVLDHFRAFLYGLRWGGSP